MNLKEGIKIEGVEFVKSGDVYRCTIPKKIFEFLKLRVKKPYDITIQEQVKKNK